MPPTRTSTWVAASARRPPAAEPPCQGLPPRKIPSRVTQRGGATREVGAHESAHESPRATAVNAAVLLERRPEPEEVAVRVPARPPQPRPIPVDDVGPRSAAVEGPHNVVEVQVVVVNAGLMHAPDGLAGGPRHGGRRSLAEVLPCGLASRHVTGEERPGPDGAEASALEDEGQDLGVETPASPARAARRSSQRKRVCPQ